MTVKIIPYTGTRSTRWSIPVGVTTITVEAWGGMSRGGGQTNGHVKGTLP